MDTYQQYIAKSRYARYLPDEKRREDWPETVQRYIDFFKPKINDEEMEQQLFDAIVNLEAMPSMRALMTAGKALERDNVAGFNCSYLPIDHPRAFDELMYILMCGAGVGYSVERQYIEKLPTIAEEFYDTDTVLHIADSKIGWAKGLKELIAMLYSGQIPKWDLTKLRPAGAPLKTFGGRSSGPEPLHETYSYTVDLFRNAAGRKLTSIECHDLCCKIADAIVVGGVRRSALISLSNLTDDRLRKAKQGDWFSENGHRALANNSAVYTCKPDFDSFVAEWVSLFESKSGERGFFSRVASQNQAARNGRRDPDQEFGTNPCSEIILRPNQFCNLSEVVVRPEDDINTMADKVTAATILGTLQATLTDFRYLRSIWSKNTAEEALLGVSLTGIMDHPFFAGQQETMDDMSLPEALEYLKGVAIATNQRWAEVLGINPSAAITCVKPSGTVSQLVDSASGIHSRFAPYYQRRITADSSDPLCQVMERAGVPWEYKIGSNKKAKFFLTAHKSPENSVMGKEHLGIPQLELWMTYQKYWCEHKPSITVTYTDEDFLEIGQWLYNNFDEVSGVAFLPEFHSYTQPPYEPISQAEYEVLSALMPEEIDWSIEEHQDVTEGSQTFACIGTSCEIV